MDRMEDIDQDRMGDRLGEKYVNTQRVSEAETRKELSAMLQDYELGPSDRDDDERSPPKLELASEFRHPTHRSPPLHSSPPFHPSQPQLPTLPLAMEISSVRFRPVPVTAQAEITSTYGHPRLNWPEMAKVNNSVLNPRIPEHK